jgi:methionyl-tRNA formyltransferase
MARVVIFARNRICIDLINSLVARDDDVVAVFSATAAPEYSVTKEEIKKHCKQLNIPFYSILNSQKIHDILEEKTPDIGLTANFPLIFNQEIIGMFTHGIINAHGGDLPRYRGNACQAWAILNGEKEIVLCAHLVEPENVDCGRIIKKLLLPITSATRVSETLDWIMRESCNLLLDSMVAILEKGIDIEKLPNSDVTEGFRCYPRKPEDGKIGWHHDAQQLIRLINASGDPYEGAFCFLNGQKFIIWQALTYKPEYSYQAINGQVLEIMSDGVVVAAQNGTIKIIEAQLEKIRGCPSKMIKSIRERLT